MHPLRLSVLGLVLLTLGLAQFSGSVAEARGGDGSDNGGGLAESRIALAWVNLERYLGSCLSLRTCGLSAEEEAISRNIRDRMESERASGKPRFENEASGRFLVEGKIRLWSTEPSANAPVYFNLDRIYRKDIVTQELLPISLPDAVGLVATAVGRHVASKTADELEALGTKIALSFRSSVTGVTLAIYGMPSLAFQVASTSGSSGDSGLLLVSDAKAVFDLSPVLERAIREEVCSRVPCEGPALLSPRNPRLLRSPIRSWDRPWQLEQTLRLDVVYQFKKPGQGAADEWNKSECQIELTVGFDPDRFHPEAFRTGYPQCWIR